MPARATGTGNQMNAGFVMRLTPSTRSGGISALVHILSIVFCSVSAGCAAVTNPVANGIPVQRLPLELLAESKADLENLPLTSLRQPPPDAYKLAPEDVLGVWIDGVLGEKGQVPPVRFSENSKLPPAVGIPVPVRANGTINLPLVDPIKVSGMTLDEAEIAIRKAFTIDKKIIQPGRDRIYVTLQQARQYHILVIRQDSGLNTAANPAGVPGGGNNATGFVISPGGSSPGLVRSGRGFAIDLAAYENDVLNALARTGGFPGSDAANEIVVERGAFKGNQEKTDLLKKINESSNGASPQDSATITRIPLRFRKNEKPALTPAAITLHTGDVVYIAARPESFFYTGGLLPSAKYLLPRDSDLDVVEAIIQAGGVINSGGVSPLNVQGTTQVSGIGSPSPRSVSVLRKTPNGGQALISVDLARAQRDPRERILIQAKDIIILQQDPQDAIANYLSNQLHFLFNYTLINTSRANASTNGTFP
jgi:protein involved in polysaccharide export with SLBB domain